MSPTYILKDVVPRKLNVTTKWKVTLGKFQDGEYSSFSKCQNKQAKRKSAAQRKVTFSIAKSRTLTIGNSVNTPQMLRTKDILRKVE